MERFLMANSFNDLYLTEYMLILDPVSKANHPLTTNNNIALINKRTSEAFFDGVGHNLFLQEFLQAPSIIFHIFSECSRTS
jgi:hypothetical protein